MEKQHLEECRLGVVPEAPHHPTSVKRGLVKCLFDRAEHLVTSPQQTTNERTHVQNALGMNGYPRRFIRTSTKKTSQPKDPKEYKTFTVLPSFHRWGLPTSQTLPREPWCSDRFPLRLYTAQTASMPKGSKRDIGTHGG